MRSILLALPIDVLERVEKLRERLRRERPGFLLSRADVLRNLILESLTRAEAWH
jgi:hypothetical protein